MIQSQKVLDICKCCSEAAVVDLDSKTCVHCMNENEK